MGAMGSLRLFSSGANRPDKSGRGASGDRGFMRMRADGRRNGLTPICADDTDVGGFSAVACRVGRISGWGSDLGGWGGLVLGELV